MSKRWIWLLIVITILLLALLFPRIMLLIMEKDMEDQVLTYGTGTLLNFDALTLGEKQTLLSDPDVTIIQEAVSPDKGETVKDSINKELQLLANCGGIVAYEELWASVQEEDVRSCKAYDPNGKNLFYFYSVKSDSFYIRLDHESGKILSLGAYTENAIGPGEFQAGTRLRSWAEYFGMSITDLAVYSQDSATPDTYGDCKLTGSGNSSCYFSVSLDPYSGYWECTPVLLPIDPSESP